MEQPKKTTAIANKPEKISLDGITLEMMVTHLVEIYGWEELGIHIKIRCFNNDPSIKSSLNFLRRTPWARKKVETLYVKLRQAQLKKKSKKPRSVNQP